MSSQSLSDWRSDLLLFLTILVATAWFHHSAPGWNVNSRLALTRAITEHGTLAVDAVLASDPEMETQDLARMNGQLFSDKTPGASFLAVPAAMVVRAVEKLTGPVSTSVRRYWITLGSCGLALAAFGVLLRRLLVALAQDGGSIGMADPVQVHRVATWTALAAAVASPAFYYGSLLMSYAPTLALIAGAALVILRATPLPEEEEPGDSAPSRPVRWSPGLLALAGVLCGLALLMEYIAGLAVAVLGLWTWGRILVAGGPGMAIRLLLAPVLMLTGAVIGWLPFAIYAQSAFGQISIPYAFHANDMFRAYMARGFMGINAPNPLVAWLVTFHPYRGLFVQAPWLAVGVLWGLVTVAGFMLFSGRAARESSQATDGEAALNANTDPPTSSVRAAGPGVILWLLASGAALAAYVIFNAGYYMWWGGWSFAPRHLVPVIPFLACCAGLAWLMGGRIWRVALVAGLAWAVLIQWTVQATDPQTPDVGRAGGTTLPRLLEPKAGELPPWPWTRQVLPRINAGQTSYAYGREVLRGWIGLVPLALLVGLGGWAASRRRRVSSGPAPAPSGPPTDSITNRTD